jgi:hypothetical protein
MVVIEIFERYSLASILAQKANNTISQAAKDFSSFARCLSVVWIMSRTVAFDCTTSIPSKAR